MSEFNGKKFYGFSLHNDPALTTTTRNFEFRYTRPEQLERAIQKVQLTDMANANQKKNIMYCKIKKNGRDINAAYQSRDIDVETHVSRTDNKIRSLSANEVDQLIGKAKSFVELGTSKGSSGNAQLDSWCNEELSDKYTQHDLQELHYLQDELDPEFVEFASVLDYRAPRPKWVEIHEESRGRAVQVDIKSLQRIEPQTVCQAYTPGYVPGGMDLLTALSPNMMPEDDNPSAYCVEDSDLEFEMMGRANYTKYCHPRPREDEMVNVSNDSGGFPEFIEIEPQIPCINLSFLKNASPIRYTDLTDETQEERIENPQMKVYINDRNKKHPDKKSEKDADKKVAKDTTMPPTKKKKKPKHIIASDKAPSTPTTPRSKFTKLNDTPRTPRTPRSPCPSPRLLKRTRSKPIPPRHVLKENTAQRGSNHSHQSHNSNRSHHSVTAGSGTDRSLRNIILSKAIEDLKVEKVAIFTKMTTTQERIIEIMDKLRLSILELSIPENSYEKSKRQKNAFEFSVRFSRNFLYPLKGMIDDLRHTSVEQLNSSSSNDACARVGSIYALVLQSLQTYQKQLRFFLLDQVPQKLTALIEMLHTVTNICLEKGLFDRNDAIIECVQERCAKFLGFLEDMHEERFLTARENYRKLNFDKHANYDLKMFMNDLNMYEPKLVPKVSQYNRHRSARNSQRKLCKNHNQKLPNTISTNSSSKLMLTKVAEDAIATQIETMDRGTSSHGIVQSFIHNSTNELSNKTSESVDNPLNKIIMEALQKVTKDQVRQVLEPIIQTLGTALDKMNNSEVIEKLLSAFDLKFIPTTLDETKKRCDADNYEKRPVDAAAGGKVVGTTVSASSITKATKASKASAQTETLLQQHKQQHQQQQPKQQQQIADEDAEDDNDTEDDDDEELDNDFNNYRFKSAATKNNNKTNLNLSTLGERNNHNKHNNNNGYDDDFDDDESSMASESETASEEPDSVESGGDDEHTSAQLAAANASMNAQMNASVNAQQFDVLYVNKKHPQPLLAELELQSAPPPSPHKTPHFQKQQAQQQQKNLPLLLPERLLFQPHKCTLGRKTAAPTVNEPARPRPLQQPLQVGLGGGVSGSVHQLPRATHKQTRLYKIKRRNLKPPPPVPTGTPTTSARSKKNEEIIDCSGGGGDYDEKPSPITYVEKMHALTKQAKAQEEQQQLRLQQQQQQAQAPTHPPATKLTSAQHDSAVAFGTMLAPPLTNPYYVGKGGDKQSMYLLQNRSVADVLNQCKTPNHDEVLEPRSSSSRRAGDSGRDTERKKNKSVLSTHTNRSAHVRHVQQHQQPASPQQNQEQQHLASSPATSNKENISDPKQRNGDNSDPKPDIKVDRLIGERDHFLNLCGNNRFYANPNYAEPWKVFSRISDKLVNEIVNSVEEDFNIGVSRFVQDFLELETKT